MIYSAPSRLNVPDLHPNLTIHSNIYPALSEKREFVGIVADAFVLVGRLTDSQKETAPSRLAGT